MPCIWHGDDRDQVRLASASDSRLDSDSIFHAFCLLRMLAADQHLSDILYFKADTGSTTKRFVDARRALHWLANLPWWHRIWTAQECILPKNSLVVYGPVEMPWSVILGGVLRLSWNAKSC